MSERVTYLVLNYNRPKETELCLRSIKRFSFFDHQITLLNNGGADSDIIYSFYKQGLIDKLILRSENSCCGCGTRELFHSLELNSDYVIYVQCDQFMYRPVIEEEINSWIQLLGKYFYIDLAGNQGNGRPSERASLYRRSDYLSIKFGKNEGHGPGPHAHLIWSEEVLQKHMKQNNLEFFTVKPHIFWDNGKNSIREYPCGGILMQETDTKAVHILNPISKRVDFPNIKLTDSEWQLILNNNWINGTIPELQKQDSFIVWNRPVCVEDLS